MSAPPLHLAFVATLYVFLVAVAILALAELARPSPRPGARLEPLDLGPLPSASIPLQGKAWIGRDSHNTIVLSDAYASGRHALVRRDQDGRWWLEDLGSRNGSYVNGQRVTSARPLGSGDVIQVGRTRFRLRA